MPDRPTSSRSMASRIWDGVVSMLNASGSLGILLLMLVINADIFGRAALDAPLAGSSEMVAFSIVGIVFLQLAHTLKVGAMTRSDALLAWIAASRPRLAAAMSCLFHLAGAALMSLVAQKIGGEFGKAWAAPGRNFMGNPASFMLPTWPLYGVMLLGIGATAIQFAVLAVRDAGRIGAS